MRLERPTILDLSMSTNQLAKEHCAHIPLLRRNYPARPSRAITRVYGCDPEDVRLLAPSVMEMVAIETRYGTEPHRSAILMESARIA